MFEPLTAAINANNWAEISRILAEAEKADAFKIAIKALVDAGGLNGQLANSFLTMWHVRGHYIRAMVGDDILLLDALPLLVPKYKGSGLMLFRGESKERWEEGNTGFSWTPRKEIAQMFGRGLNCIRGGVLLSCYAHEDAIIAGPSLHSEYLGEDEYLVDTRKLKMMTAIEAYSTTD